MAGMGGMVDMPGMGAAATGEFGEDFLRIAEGEVMQQHHMLLLVEQAEGGDQREPPHRLGHALGD